MTTIRRFCCNDLLRYSTFHLEPCFRDSRSLCFRIMFLVSWPNSCHIALAPCNQIMGYIFGRIIDVKEEQKHGKLVSLSCDEKYGKPLIKRLVDRLEEVNDKIDKAFYMEVLLHPSDIKALQLYQTLGYVFFKRKSIPPGEEDSLYLRRPLSLLLVAISLSLLSQQLTDDREIMLHCVD